MTQYERVADTTAHTGEGPLWHPEEELVYWVDIPNGKLFAYDPETDEYDLVYQTDGVPLGGYTIEEDGALLLFTHGTVSRLEPGADKAEPIAEVSDAETRFNDVIADPEGRVFCGTMPGENELGDLYRVDPDGSVTLVVEDVDIPNGMGFTDDLETFYFTESEAHVIYAFDYDRETGELSNQRTFVEVPTDDGIPDGMTIDENGDIWSARWDGGRVVRYSPDGEVLEEIELPARKVSSATFGGPEYEDLYLTTALTDNDRDEEGDGAGALFRVSDVGPSGVPEFRSRISLE
ncbi:SMP-30/gluconolactonase/LRE family protein [Natronolimnobius sp. AArcel1]|uniref:SMP-30/gluconolactonase/LRE family protein n=1 Tax=Natronolimnobius sp. AArcel1 TaxID=1679093 RepID=UPI0013E9A497|nr:SMP-30/gluconolactonase/LRE family protein [Natronolimnobius sp. AArcel1]NGM69826.1 SMP-30/gluconolactonase/LRE family protein [Natronolimnobius sp. AArcel1]